MKRFLVFQGDTYYPGGGWDDFTGDFDTIEEARASRTRLDWIQIIDTTTMEEAPNAPTQRPPE